MNHTPGPWKDVSMQFSMGWRCIVNLPNGRFIDIADPRDRATDDEDRANAALIASAPEIAKKIEQLELQNDRLQKEIERLNQTGAALPALAMIQEACPAAMIASGIGLGAEIVAKEYKAMVRLNERYQKALEFIGNGGKLNPIDVAQRALGEKRKCPSTYTHSNRGKLECEKDEAHLHRRGDVEHQNGETKWMSL